MDKPETTPPTNICPSCGAAFNCGMNAGEATCWCTAYPPLLAVPADEAVGRCYCPACLKKQIEAALKAG